VRRWRLGAAVLLLGAAAVSAGVAWRHDLAQRQRQRGEALFMGTASLPGRLAGHDLVLPTLATRCINCHGSDAVVPATGAVAPSLTRQRLTSLLSRRGAPPSRFDAVSLCRALRSGVDPAQVLLPTSMPRYEATDAQCADLWAHLASP
jgi:hypothetical protein